MLARLSCALLGALLDEGLERDYGIELVADACWAVYRIWGRIPHATARLVTRDPVERMRFCVNAFLRFPFNPPAYRWDDVDEPAGRGFDMLRCPVAEELARRGADDLAVGSWCALDYPLAEMWGGRLERTGTLAGGAQCCDFRFRAGRGSG